MLNAASYGGLHNNIVDIAGSELICKSVNTVGRITYIVLVQTLNPAQSINL